MGRPLGSQWRRRTPLFQHENAARPFEVQRCLNSGHCLALPFSSNVVFFLFPFLLPFPLSLSLFLSLSLSRYRKTTRRQLVSDKDRVKSFPQALAKSIFSRHSMIEVSLRGIDLRQTFARRLPVLPNPHFQSNFVCRE